VPVGADYDGHTKTSVDEPAPTVQSKPLVDLGEVQKQTTHIGSLCECSAVVKDVHEDLPFTTPELHDEIWNGERASAWVEHFFAAPQELSPCFIAEASEVQHRIDTGLPMNVMKTSDRLTTVATLPGINTPYVYISTGLSCGFLHKEDMNLLSTNILHKGH